jgi:hypothetical protein
VVDAAGNNLEATFTITVTDIVDESGGGTAQNPPSALSLDNLAFAENNYIGALVARLSTTDPDENDVHTYHLVPGTGDTDNGNFSILGDMLLAATIFDYETQQTYDIRIRVVDAEGYSLENTFTITITDVDESVGIAPTRSGDLRIYPNPMSQSATVEFPNPEGTRYRMRIMDLTGKTLLLRDNIFENRFIIYREDLGRGYYLLELHGDKVFHGRLVIE